MPTQPGDLRMVENLRSTAMAKLPRGEFVTAEQGHTCMRKSWSLTRVARNESGRGRTPGQTVGPRGGKTKRMWDVAIDWMQKASYHKHVASPVFVVEMRLYKDSGKTWHDLGRGNRDGLEVRVGTEPGAVQDCVCREKEGMRGAPIGRNTTHDATSGHEMSCAAHRGTWLAKVKEVQVEKVSFDEVMVSRKDSGVVARASRRFPDTQKDTSCWTRSSTDTPNYFFQNAE
ncbi:hypothetical protein B0H14DRAFT_2608178 [Mycena olivaceomarginata]|nr:hypothetical protein B0H14DRAFT_2608178 [Mycena olivaceomarginata]